MGGLDTSEPPTTDTAHFGHQNQLNFEETSELDHMITTQGQKPPA